MRPSVNALIIFLFLFCASSFAKVRYISDLEDGHLFKITITEVYSGIDGKESFNDDDDLEMAFVLGFGNPWVIVFVIDLDVDKSTVDHKFVKYFAWKDIKQKILDGETELKFEFGELDIDNTQNSDYGKGKIDLLELLKRPLGFMLRDDETGASIKFDVEFTGDAEKKEEEYWSEQYSKERLRKKYGNFYDLGIESREKLIRYSNNFHIAIRVNMLLRDYAWVQGYLLTKQAYRYWMKKGNEGLEHTGKQIRDIINQNLDPNGVVTNPIVITKEMMLEQE